MKTELEICIQKMELGPDEVTFADVWQVVVRHRGSYRGVSVPIMMETGTIPHASTIGEAVGKALLDIRRAANPPVP